MKKILSLLIALVVTATVFAQVTVTIDNVKTADIKGPYVQDTVFYTISAEGYEVYGAGVSGVLNNNRGFNSSLWNPHVASNTTGSYIGIVLLTQKQASQSRTYYAWAAYGYIDGLTSYDPTDPYYVTSAPYTVNN
jgi:hypothetical protein